MTHKERLIISAYTGYLMVDFPELHKFIEETLGRPVWTHELASDKVWAELREKLKDKFLDLCEIDADDN